MTALIGQAAYGAAFLGADTRRRDHITGGLRLKRKLHQWSDQLIFSQGGAGSGAADTVVEALFQSQKIIGSSRAEVASALGDLAPPMMEKAARRWRNEGKVIPPTWLTLATVCEETGLGEIWSADLHTGETRLFGPYPQPTFSGSHTRELVEVASAINYELRKGLLDPLPFDRLVSGTIAMLGASHPSDIQLPADIGFVTWDRNSKAWKSAIVLDVMPGQYVRPEFLARFEEGKWAANDL